ncbi:hypothetical protein [Pseudoxanthomonas suwonensis]|uniref:Secreted protein n=1 Tax=Pseudoxanthomonas suwonensis TaxID=314722 RepID=A0A0E3YZS2_9GAMM|nr:hypothetical protein [Pseudoxanthomonas suwonensis]AKC86098.1 hypothetical protein WQ53_04235 [Pseudoxanthomonas suwonensis]
MQRRLSPLCSVLLLALAVATFAPAAVAQSSGRTAMEQQMTPEEFKAAGLHKLSAEELAALHDWVQRQQSGVAGTASPATTPAPAAAPLPADAAVAAGAAALSAAEIERIREEAREEGRKEVKETNRGFFDFGSDEPIKSTLVGEFRGFAKGNRYTLANGQVWEQVEPARLEGVKRTDPAVTIKPGLLNVWFLRIDGYNTPAKVRRIK